MPYRTILVHADQSPHAPARIRLAATLAHAHGAHLIGAAMTGISRFVYGQGELDLHRTVIDGYVDVMEAHATKALEHFDAIARNCGVESHEPRLISDDPEGGLLQLAPFADLLVLSQADPDHPTPGGVRGIAEYVMLNCARPVLVVPYAGVHERPDGRALVGWNDSIEATRALTQAIPLLQRAAGVTVAKFREDAKADSGPAHFDDLASWLARHQIRAEIVVHDIKIDAGEALLSLAAELGAELIVMGGYGHTRFRELVLGGATDTVLRTTTVPIAMSH